MARIMRREGDVSKRSLWQKIKDVALLDVGVLARGGVSAGNLERLEELLLEADFGVPVTLRLVAEVEGRAARGQAKTEIEFHEALREGVERALRAG
ncbi:MAG: signal recognition particle receptor subunit alpha, partial [Gemmatimonadaceae bacterium]